MMAAGRNGELVLNGDRVSVLLMEVDGDGDCSVHLMPLHWRLANI